MQTPYLFLLASQSPRRAQLLREAGVLFEQRSPPYRDPDQPPAGLRGDQAEGYAIELADRKANSLVQAVDQPCVILAADTLCVDRRGRLVGKPADRQDAQAILNRLIEAPHRVITGVALYRCGPEQVTTTSFAETATVHFGSITVKQLEAYLATDHWQGKAGGYNLFERQAEGWPIDIVGDPTTVVGLPMQRLIPLLETFV